VGTDTISTLRRWSMLGIGLFVERFYCRYLCPLGAALAKGQMPSACPYVAHVEGYRAPVVLSPEEYAAARPSLQKALARNGEAPAWADEDQWRSFQQG
jgi:hypothetical protein